MGIFSFTKKNKQQLRVAMLAPVWESVPPKSYGGTELVVSLLTEKLVEHGHKVTLFASGDSQTSATLDSVIASRLSIKTPLYPGEQTYTGITNSEHCFSRWKEFDVIHTNADVPSVAFSRFVGVPVVSTLHSPIREAQKSLYQYNGKNVYYCSISNAFRQHNPAVEYFETVYHGIEIEKFNFSPGPGKHLVSIGRMVPDKGFKAAAEICRELSQELRIAAPIPEDSAAGTASWLYDKEYWENEVKPLVDGKLIQYVGEVTADQKSEYFGSAKALLFPLEWDEPFGLTVIEAMACGTPVIAYDRGAMKELIDHGKTGFLVKPGDVNGLKEAIGMIGGIDRSECRKRVENLFTSEAMSRHYEEVYLRAIADFKNRAQA